MSLGVPVVSERNPSQWTAVTYITWTVLSKHVSIISDNVGSIIPHNRIETYSTHSVSYLIFIHADFIGLQRLNILSLLPRSQGVPQDVSGRGVEATCGVQMGSCIISDMYRLVWQKMFKFWLYCLVVFSMILSLVLFAVIWTVLIYNGDLNLSWSCEGCLELLVWGRINCEPLKGNFCCARDSHFRYPVSPAGFWLILLEWRLPKDFEGAACFMGIASFCWKFVSEFANVAAPLNALHNKGTR